MIDFILPPGATGGVTPAPPEPTEASTWDFLKSRFPPEAKDLPSVIAHDSIDTLQGVEAVLREFMMSPSGRTLRPAPRAAITSALRRIQALKQLAHRRLLIESSTANKK